jgi:hypothetical protein
MSDPNKFTPPTGTDEYVYDYDQAKESWNDYQVKAARRDKQMNRKNSSKRMIWVTWRQEAIHKFPAALEDPKFATGDEYDVSFLGYPHRHIFHFKVGVQVWHDDREIEFIQLSRWLQNLYKGEGESVLDLDFKSCEMIADDMFDQIAQRFPDREVSIEVSEDGENGCLVRYPV